MSEALAQVLNPTSEGLARPQASPFAPQKCVNEAHFRGAKGDIKGDINNVGVCRRPRILVSYQHPSSNACPTSLAQVVDR